MVNPRIIVIGASAGGVEALRTVVNGLPRGFAGAVVVVLHIPPNRHSLLPEILGRSSVLPVETVSDGMAIQSGHVYVAPPDEHVILEARRMRLVRGPRENGHRPAIDPLFRSAANSVDDAIGVILSGTLDDGTAGLAAIKDAGGMALVQDPEDAAFSDMPRSAIENVEVDKILPVSEIAAQLAAWAEAPSNGLSSRKGKAAMKKKPLDSTEDGSARQNIPSIYTCPDCAGTLWEGKNGKLSRFVCRVGHSYTLDALEAKKTDDVEAALWIAVRTLEERADLQRRLAEQARGRRHWQVAKTFEEKAREMSVHALAVRRVLEREGQTSMPREKVHK